MGQPLRAGRRVLKKPLIRASAATRPTSSSTTAMIAFLAPTLVDQICEPSGGPCKYKGKDMKTAHAGMGITDVDCTALVEDLTGALDKFKVGDKEKSDLLGALGPMKKDIVER